jgi:hypothetical protein
MKPEIAERAERATAGHGGPRRATADLEAVAGYLRGPCSRRCGWR